MNSNISEREQSPQLPPKRGPSKKDKVKGCGNLKDNAWIKPMAIQTNQLQLTQH